MKDVNEPDAEKIVSVTGRGHCYTCGQRITLANPRRGAWCSECEGGR